MRIYHDREEAIRQLATELRVIELPNGVSRAITMEKYIWDEYDFITGRVYGYPYNTDEVMFERAEQNAKEMNISFDYSLDQVVRLGAYVLRGRVLQNA